MRMSCVAWVCTGGHFPLLRSSEFVCYLRVLGLYFGPEAGRCSCFTGTVWCKVLLRHNESLLPKPTTCSAAWHAPHLPCVQISSFNFVFFLHFYVRLFHLLVCSFICLFRLSILIYFFTLSILFLFRFAMFVRSFFCLVCPLFVCSFACALFNLSILFNWSVLSCCCLSVRSFVCWFVCPFFNLSVVSLVFYSSILF